MTPQKKTQNEWEKELKEISASLIGPDGDGCEYSSISGLQEYKQLVDFIHSLLLSARSEERKQVIAECLEAGCVKMKSQQQIWQERMHKKGLCKRCGKKVSKINTWLCPIHRIKSNKEVVKRNHERASLRLKGKI